MPAPCDHLQPRPASPPRPHPANHHQVIKRVEARIAAWTLMPVGNGEGLQVRDTRDTTLLAFPGLVSSAKAFYQF